jgi:hypothetical protein
MKTGVSGTTERLNTVVRGKPLTLVASRLKVFLAVVSVVICAGCAGSAVSGTGPAQQPSASSTSSTTSLPNGQNVTPPFAPDKTWTWAAKNSDGYSFTNTLAAEGPDQLTDVPLLPGFSSEAEVVSACTFDSTTDALIPVELTLTNTTPSFAADVEVSFALPVDDAIPAMVPQSIQVVASYSQGIQCETAQQLDGSNDQSTWVESCSQLQPNASCLAYAYVVLSDYFTPDSPSGNPAVLQGAQLLIGQWPAIGYVDVLTGPGAVGANSNEPVIPLSGDTPPKTEGLVTLS